MQKMFKATLKPAIAPQSSVGTKTLSADLRAFWQRIPQHPTARWWAKSTKDGAQTTRSVQLGVPQPPGRANTNTHRSATTTWAIFYLLAH